MDMTTIAERIFSARKLAGLTLSQVADELGISHPSVKNWESGKTKPALDRLPALAKVLGTTTEWLLEGGSDKSGTATTQTNSNATMSVGERLKIARQLAGLSQAQLAAKLHITRSAMAGWESGAAVLPRERITDVLSHLKIDEEWLLNGQGSGLPVSTPMVPQPRDRGNGTVLHDLPQSGSNLVPVYGQAVAGVEGQFPMNGTVLYWVVAPPQIAKIEGAYAVSIAGDSMFPRYEDGEVAFIDPTRRVKKGDYVVAQIHSDESDVPQAYVKRFIRHNEEELVLDQFNPPKELDFDHDRVISVHYIAMAGSPEKE